MKNEPEFLTTAEVAELLRTSPRSVYDWRLRRTGPPSVKVGRRRLYLREDVMKWARDKRDAP